MIPEQMPTTAPQADAGVSVVVEASYRWDFASRSAFAGDPDLLFKVEQLGVLRMIDTRTMRELETALQVRSVRPLTITCSPSASGIAILFEDGKVTLYRCRPDSDGVPLSLETVGTWDFRLPETEDPVAVWHGDRVWFQAPNGSLTGVDLAGKCVDDDDSPEATRAELSALVFTRNKRLIALRQDGETILSTPSLAAVRIPNADIVSAREIHTDCVALAFPCGGIVREARLSPVRDSRAAPR